MRQPSGIEVTKQVAHVLPVVLAQHVLRLLGANSPGAGTQPVTVMHDAIAHAVVDGSEANPAAVRMDTLLQGTAGLLFPTTTRTSFRRRHCAACGDTPAVCLCDHGWSGVHGAAAHGGSRHAGDCAGVGVGRRAAGCCQAQRC